ncbi:universal stress protein [Roseospira marina]|uniref:Universal stress protein n=1 Tax=Roseospira marina TaxID=140057 RepID=A0A5M6I5S2_9PROT|nr:universal stress protein [Roseospira marina]KAA5603512.1 universal stress protein [Roseospira marina]MBB4315066.1 nucleotide-binding universal stress UspA family protein [Roseospira marina]MBB5088164.1 nucleotide-binding universal stress UspA family protein [Roseospira marina]
MFKRILVSVDLDAPFDWDKTFPTAADLARQWGASLDVMTVVPDFGMSMVSQFFPTGYEKKMATMVMDRLREQVDSRLPEGMTASHLVGEGNVYEAVLQMVGERKIDLVVIGAHRPELSDYLLGPNAARVVRHAHCSVLVVRHR